MTTRLWLGNVCLIERLREGRAHTHVVNWCVCAWGVNTHRPARGLSGTRTHFESALLLSRRKILQLPTKKAICMGLLCTPNPRESVCERRWKKWCLTFTRDSFRFFFLPLLFVLDLQIVIKLVNRFCKMLDRSFGKIVVERLVGKFTREPPRCYFYETHRDLREDEKKEDERVTVFARPASYLQSQLRGFPALSRCFRDFQKYICTFQLDPWLSPDDFFRLLASTMTLTSLPPAKTF